MILGATGLMGGRLVTHLAARLRGVEVVAAARRATARASEFPNGIRLVDIDLERPETFSVTFTGLTDLVLAVAGRPGRFDAIEHRGAVAAARAAVEQGVRRIVHITGTATPTAPDWYEAGVAKRFAEAEIKALPAGVVTLRPSWLMESLPRFERNGGMALFGSGRVRMHWLALDDLAEVVVQVLDTPEPESGSYPVLGPEMISLRDAARLYARARGLKPGIRCMPMPVARAVAALSGKIRPVVQLTRVFEHFDEEPLTHVPIPFRRPETTLNQWLR